MDSVMRNIVIFWDSPVSKNVGHAVGCDGSGDVLTREHLIRRDST